VEEKYFASNATVAQAAGVVGVGAATRLPSGDDVMKPWARRLPSPPYDRGLGRFSPQPGHPASWLHDSTSSTRASGVRATLIRWKLSKPTSRSHRSSDAQQQVGWDTARGPLKIGGRSPLIIKDLDLYPQPLTTNRSPTINSEELDLAW